MSFGRYFLLKSAVGFSLFVVVTFPFLFFAGWLASLMPKAVAIALVGLVWLIGMTFGTHMLTERLSKRWSK